MSRIWKMPVVLVSDTEANINWNEIIIKWKKWTLNFIFSDNISVIKEENTIVVSKNNDSADALWGTTRSIINNMVQWVSEWFTKSLEIIWVWYKFEVQWQVLVLSIWYSHKVDMPIPNGLEVKMDEKLKNTIHISWIDKQLVWEFAAKIRAKKKPEPYKGKWIKYVWEHIRRKAWKSGK